MSNYIEIAKFGSSFGIIGQLKVYSYAEFALNDYSYFYLQNESIKKKLYFIELLQRNKYFLAKIKDCNNIEQTKYYINKSLFVHKEQLEKLNNDEYYWHQLIGLKVKNLQHESLGVIDSLFSVPAHDILVCKKNKRQYLIPYLKDFILEINLVKNLIIVNWSSDL